MAPVRPVHTFTNEPKAKREPRCGIMTFGSIGGDPQTPRVERREDDEVRCGVMNLKGMVFEDRAHAQLT